MPASAVSERRRQQNRDAQRTYRKSLLKRIEELESRQNVAFGDGKNTTPCPSLSATPSLPINANSISSSREIQSLETSLVGEHSFLAQRTPRSKGVGDHVSGPVPEPLPAVHIGPDDGDMDFDESTIVPLSPSWWKDVEMAGVISRDQQWTGRDGCTVLHAAIMKGDEAIVKLLVDNGGDLNALTPHHMDALHLATERKLVSIARLLLEAGANVNSADDQGCPVLLKAIIGGDEEMVRLLLEFGADVNQTIISRL